MGNLKDHLCIEHLHSYCAYGIGVLANTYTQTDYCSICGSKVREVTKRYTPRPVSPETQKKIHDGVAAIMKKYNEAVASNNPDAVIGITGAKIEAGDELMIDVDTGLIVPIVPKKDGDSDHSLDCS